MRLPFVFLFLGVATFAAASEPTQIESGTQQDGRRVFYRAELADAGVIVLDANNGFFAKDAFVAEGKHPAPSETERSLIHFHYTHLVALEKESSGTAHWYVWVPVAGAVEVNVNLSVPASDDGVAWSVQWDDQTKTVIAKTSSKESAQPWDLAFVAKEPGLHKIAIRKLADRASRGTQIHNVTLTGPAIAAASLVRARWRPAAVHTQYASTTCPQTKLWVIESQSVADYSSYSPINTPFGYFGGSFSADRAAVGNLNFSMWAANGNAKSAPPLSQTPHLLATGNPDAEFGGFGHEGSGVKIRNWDPLDHRPTSIIQALRMDVADEMATYSGYVFDDRDRGWKLFAVGRRPVKKRRNQNDANDDDQPTLRISSFCEIPGPASRQRTGDRRRVIRRRGWVYDNQGRWHAIDRQTRNAKSDEPKNQSIGAQDGWFTMATGGMEMFLPKPAETVLPNNTVDLPEYLRPDIARQLFQYPAQIGDASVSNLTSDTATIHYSLPQAGTNATAMLYYGPRDCLSFVPRDDFHATERNGVVDKMYSSDRTWQSATKSLPVQTGRIAFSLTNLQPATSYYYRLFLTNDAGKIWSFKAGRFETR